MSLCRFLFSVSPTFELACGDSFPIKDLLPQAHKYDAIRFSITLAGLPMRIG